MAADSRSTAPPASYPGQKVLSAVDLCQAGTSNRKKFFGNNSLSVSVLTGKGKRKLGATVLKIEVQFSEHISVLRCAGRLVQGRETAALRDAVLAQERPGVVLDLSEVTAIDAGGLGLLVELQRWAQATHRTLTLFNPTFTVRNVLDATGLSSVLPVYRDETAVHHAA